MRALFLTVLFLSSACDSLPSLPHCMTPGGPFGPCVDGPVPCILGSTCVDTDEVGSICSPQLVSGETIEARVCASPIGDVECNPDADVCVVPCATDEDCGAGTVCDSEATLVCVWPPGSDPSAGG